MTAADRGPSRGSCRADGNAGFKRVRHVARCMQCHFCEDEAAVAVEKDHVRVGLCVTHLQERIDELSDAEWLESVESEIDEHADG